MKAATAAAEPLEDPPGVRSRSCGLVVLPGVYTASSVVTVLPIIIAPAARSWLTTAASDTGLRPACSTVPSSVGISADRHSMQSPEGSALLVDPVASPRLLKRSVWVEIGPRLDRIFDFGDTLEASLNQFLGRDLAPANRLCRLNRR